MVVVYWSWNCESCPEIKYFSLFLRTALLFQLIPARGRKLFNRYRNFELVLIFQLIPARGRKPLRYPEHQQQPDFNLSPQGDGNYLTLKSSDMVWISTYPRKGTETSCFQPRPYPTAYFSLSPQGDGNLFTPSVSFAAMTFQLIPARGRKLNCLRTTYIKLRISTYPRKNPLRRCAPALPKGELL